MKNLDLFVDLSKKQIIVMILAISIFICSFLIISIDKTVGIKEYFTYPEKEYQELEKKADRIIPSDISDYTDDEIRIYDTKLNLVYLKIGIIDNGEKQLNIKKERSFNNSIIYLLVQVAIILLKSIGIGIGFTLIIIILMIIIPVALGFFIVQLYTISDSISEFINKRK